MSTVQEQKDKDKLVVDDDGSDSDEDMYSKMKYSPAALLMGDDLKIREQMTEEEFLALEEKVLEESKKRAVNIPETAQGASDFVNKFPLFATNRPQESNKRYDAMDALAEESTPENRALMYKNSGNEAYKLGVEKKSNERFHHALTYYTQALDLKCKDKAINSTVLINRAMVHLALESYGHCVKDCEAALALDETLVKAYYRAAKASFEVGKYTQAAKFLMDGEKHVPKKDKRNQKMFKDLKVKAVNKQREEVQKRIEKEAKKHAAAMEKQNSKTALNKHLSARNIVMGPPEFTLNHTYDAKVYMDTVNVLHWPVIFLYEEVLQSDYVRDMKETDTFITHLREMFPPKADFAPWDEHKKYTAKNLQIRLETTDKNGNVKVTPVKLKATLGSVINNWEGAPYVAPKFPTFLVTTKS